jgi:hypothetical protein
MDGDSGLRKPVAEFLLARRQAPKTFGLELEKADGAHAIDDRVARLTPCE